MRKLALVCLWSLLLGSSMAYASIFGQIHGVVHDPKHRPIVGAHIELRAANSAFTQTTLTIQDGTFTLSSIPLGDYIVTVSQTGFDTAKQTLTLASDTAPVLHFELQLGTVQQSVSVENPAYTANVNTVTPTTLVDRETIG